MESTTQIYMEISLDTGSLLSGDTMASGYENRIDINSFRLHGRAQKSTLKEIEGGVKANLNFNRVAIEKVFDRSSLLLGGMLNRKEKFTEAKISIDQQYIDPKWVGKINNESLIIYLYSGYVADIKFRTSEANAGASITEEVSLSFYKCSVYYYAEDRDRKGKLGDDYRWEPCIFEMQGKEQGS